MTGPENPLVTCLAKVRPVYEVPENDLVGEVLIPALETADRVDIAVGFFSSHCISQIAPGLASLVDRDITCRLLVSPELSEEDREAIERGVSTPEAVIDAFMVDLLRAPPDALVAHTADCLAYLLARGTLQLRCVLMDRGMFHKKMWIFEKDGVRESVHGSGNMTARGLLVNGEQMTIDRPWKDGTSATERVADLSASFDLEWDNKKPGRLTIEPKQMLVLLEGRSDQRTDPPSTAEFWRKWLEDRDAGLAPELPPGMAHPPTAKRLLIPDWLDWKNPPYSHQQSAIEALAERDYSALLAIATGGGKTKSALIAATQLQNSTERSVLVVIIVPTRVLADQWALEVREFAVNPTVLTGMDGSDRQRAYDDIEASLRSGEGRTEVLISTLAMFTGDGPLKEFVEESASRAVTVLIADEVHNFGAPSFISDPPQGFQHRIGLSATPVRQYDAEGTAELFAYFHTESEPAFTFTLREAIRSGCLTPYRYILHKVDMTDEEMDRYRDLTAQLLQTGFGHDAGMDFRLTPRQEQLLRERRALVEQASAKLAALRELLRPLASTLSHTLIYCSAKLVVRPHSEKQIDLVRAILQDLRITTHMYTAVESGRVGSRAFLKGFASGDYQTLLAMKVLDEGVDVPAAHRAFLLASSTVEREWVQRRGRLLRNFPGKEAAELHDFIVMAPDPGDTAGKSLLKAELRRAEHFTADAENKYDDGGPRDVIASIEDRLEE